MGTIIFWGIILLAVIIALMETGHTVIGWGIIILIAVIVAIIIYSVVKSKMKENQEWENKRKEEEERRLKYEERNIISSKIKQNPIIKDFVTRCAYDFCERIKKDVYSSRYLNLYVFEDRITFSGDGYYDKTLRFQNNNLPDLKNYNQTRAAEPAVMSILCDVIRKNLNDELYNNIQVKEKNTEVYRYSSAYESENKIIFTRLPNPNTEW